MTTDYGQRACLECGAAFTAAYASQVVCSAACKGQRRRAVHIASRARRKAAWVALTEQVRELHEALEAAQGLLVTAGQEADALRGELEAAREALAARAGKARELDLVRKENAELLQKLSLCGVFA